MTNGILAAMPGSIRIMRKYSVLIGLLLVFILPSGCSMAGTKHNSESFSGSACRCINVNGTVLGKLKVNATITLYQEESFDYESITGIINEGHPERISKVSANQSFILHCLPEGHYLFNIPASSYDYSFGSPIPAESTQGNLEVDVILQGGNSQNLFSAFSVERIS